MRRLMILWSFLFLSALFPAGEVRAEKSALAISPGMETETEAETETALQRGGIDAFQGFSWGTDLQTVKGETEGRELPDLEEGDPSSLDTCAFSGTERGVPARYTFFFDPETGELCAGEVSFEEIGKEDLAAIRDACLDEYGEAVLSGDSEKNGLYALWVDGEGEFLFLSSLFGLQVSSGKGVYLDRISEKVKKAYYVNIGWELRKVESFGGFAGVSCACD